MNQTHTHIQTQQQTQKRAKKRTAAVADSSKAFRQNSLLGATSVAALAGIAFYFRNELMGLIGYQKIHMAPHIQAKLPIAKGFKTVSDYDGNYDMDGVSFDTEGVIVGSDGHFETESEQQVPH